MIIEFAKIMSSKEKSYFFKSIYRKGDHNKCASKSLLNNRAADIFSQYDKIELQAVLERDTFVKDLRQKKIAWLSKKCTACGHKLRVVNSDFGYFWGCPNYHDKSKGKHSSFNANFGDYVDQSIGSASVRISQHWASGIRKSLALPGYISATNIIDFLRENGRQDLREKYYGRGTKKSIGGFQKGKVRSIKEEARTEKLLRSKYKTTLSQQGIRYKLAGFAEKKCFIDFIASDDEFVNIVEVKGGYSDIDISQLSLYKMLVTYIMDARGDKRKINATFLIFSEPDITYYNTETNYILFDNIQSSVITKDELNILFSENDFEK